MVKKCVICGAEFETKRSNVKTCSEKCLAEYMHAYYRNWARRTKTPNRVKICAVCGREFEPEHLNAFYCSGSCRKQGEAAIQRNKWRNREQSRHKLSYIQRLEELESKYGALKDDGLRELVAAWG